MVSQEGFGPSTLALKERYSTAELLAHQFTMYGFIAKRSLKIIITKSLGQYLRHKIYAPKCEIRGYPERFTIICRISPILGAT